MLHYRSTKGYSEELSKKIGEDFEKQMPSSKTSAPSARAFPRSSVTSPRQGRSLAPKKRPSSRPKLDEGASKLLGTDLEERPPLRCCTVAAQGVEAVCNPPAPSPHSTCKLGIFRGAAGPGFEPGLSDSESLVLPLHHPARQRRIL